MIECLKKALQFEEDWSWIGFIDFDQIPSSSVYSSGILEWWNQKKNQVSTYSIKGILWSTLTPNFENFSVPRALSFLKKSTLCQVNERKILNSVFSLDWKKKIITVYCLGDCFPSEEPTFG